MATKNELSQQETFFTRKPNFGQVSLRGLGLCLLYRPLCFDYDLHSTTIINLRMKIVFNNISLQCSHPPCEYFTRHQFNIPGSRDNRYKL